MTPNLKLGYTQYIINAASLSGVLRNQLAYMLATTYWETNNTMEPVKEAYWLSEDWRRTNLKYYPWYGRGFVQLTWEDNYKRADKELGLNGALVAEPDRALDRDVATPVLITGMLEGWFTGKKIGDYVTLQKSDFVNARRVINGTDRADEIASIAKDYDKALLDVGYGVEPVPTLEDRVASLEEWRASVENKA